ncbi:hypothetical protein H2200_008691 [Cladophialophora chaetospira]|uniref:alpha-galactosidase n=1 Tax=Cladophialophora chaetospira TaxID=386627 RepID=A0AA39CFJ8_9EURO|nr:hypothetical protein H2200_008691 [Cladophialophora chaetospira]
MQKSARKRLLMAVSILVVVFGLAVGLGVGLTQKHSHNSSATATATPTPTSSPSNSTSSAKVWQPKNGTTWNIQLLKPLTSPSKGDFDVWDIDLFDNTQETISSLKNQSAKVICYFSAGSSEDWRPDYSSFASSDLGNGLDGWPGENWLNLSSPNVRKTMEKRLDLAHSKGCDGVDPDNVDGYDNDNGLSLTQQDSIEYMQFLATAAHQRGMAIGLKNAGALISSLLDAVQWSVNEQCV